MADNPAKAKLDDYIKEAAKGTALECMAEFRKEAEAQTRERDASWEARLAALTTRSVEKAEEKDKGITAARLTRAIAAGKGDVTKALDFAKKLGFGEKVEKALATTPATAGGYVVPPEYSAELIELLYNKVAVRKLGATTVPMPQGTLTMPKLSAGIAATYIGELQGTNAVQPSFGIISMSWKKLRATVPISNDLLLFNNPKVDDVVRNDMTQAFALAEDSAFLRGSGAGNAPKGIDAFIPTANPDHSIATADDDASDLTVVMGELFALPRLLEEQNIPFTKPGWCFSPRTKYALMKMRDSVGNFYFLEEMRSEKLLGYPFVCTNQVPSNLGSGTDESIIYFGDWNDALIGESSDLTIDVSNEASYLDEAGNLQSAFALDVTVIRGIARHDFSVRREVSFAKLTGLKWGKTA